MKKQFLLILTTCFLTCLAQAQFNDILKRKAEEGVKRGAEAATEKTIDKVVDKSLGKIFNKGEKKTIQAKDSSGISATPIKTQEAPSIKTYSKFDFISGEKILGYDDFAEEAVGDFPMRWATNASGEIITTDHYQGKWLKVSKQGYYIPQFIKSLPENFTAEFDVLFIPPVKGEGPNTATLGFEIIHNVNSRPNFDFAPARAYFQLDPYMGNVNITSYDDKGGKILSNEFQAKGIQRQKSFTHHISVWRQKTRLRVYLNEIKLVDAPTMLPSDIQFNSIRFATSLNNDGSDWLISNFKFASGLPDTRNKLISEGKFSTTGILFDVNAATIKAASYGVLKDIAQVLKDNPGININIVGHTDSDGDANQNIELSKKRAQAVKDVLIHEFGIEEKRMITDGKGESIPVAPNNSAEGKAQNRRVEFIKQ